MSSEKCGGCIREKDSGAKQAGGLCRECVNGDCYVPFPARNSAAESRVLATQCVRVVAKAQAHTRHCELCGLVEGDSENCPRCSGPLTPMPQAASSF